MRSGNKKPSATLLGFISSAPSVHERLALGIRPPSPETRQRQMSEVIRTLEGDMAASFEIGKA